MKVIAVVSQKGGAGKTTVATELGVVAVQNGYRTLIFDLDPQASAGIWGDDRGGKAPQVIGVQAPRLAGFLQQAKTEEADVVLIDTAPNADSIALAAAKAADIVLIPSKPSPRDAKAIGASLRAVADIAAKPAFVVLNEAKTKAAINSLMLDAFAHAGVAVCPVQLGDRVAFVNALVAGNTATEWEPSGKAAEEVHTLWRWLCQQVGIPETRKTGNTKSRKPVKSDAQPETV
jgi:chromosome partitioning protein